MRFARVALVLLAFLAATQAAMAQGRGGPPAGLPAGGFPGGAFPGGGFPGGGVPGGGFRGGGGGASRGLPGDLPARGGFEHGPPGWVAERAGSAARGLERAAQAGSSKLAEPEKARAAAVARANPALYEVDRGGAVVIRGEVLASGLDAGALADLERRGFAVSRREVLPELGLDLAVITRGGLSGVEVLQQVRRVYPLAIVALNHVLFDSGTRAIAARGGTASPQAGQRETTRVGLVDTAVSPRVEALPRVRVVRRAFVPGGDRPELHGTAVAALLAAAPGPVTIYAAAVATAARAASSDLLVRALGWMAGQHVPVINISMVGPYNPIVALALATLVQHGYTIVAPVGNDGPAARPLFPASYPGVIAVSAASPDGRLLPEASRVSRVDFVAPGTAVVPDPDGRQTMVRGTSFAAPVVSRMLADRIHAPDPAMARAAVRALAKEARVPSGDRRWTGRGLLAGR